MSLGGGDKLAKGGVKAQFQPADVTDEKFNEAFGGESRKLNVMSDEERQAAELELQRLQDEAKSGGSALTDTGVKFRAISDRIIVRRAEAEDKTITGLYLADESKEKPAEGIVVAVGPGKFENGIRQPPTVEPGERVVFGKFSGAEVKIALENYVVLREEDIFLVKE